MCIRLLDQGDLQHSLRLFVALQVSALKLLFPVFSNREFKIEVSFYLILNVQMSVSLSPQKTLRNPGWKIQGLTEVIQIQKPSSNGTCLARSKMTRILKSYASNFIIRQWFSTFLLQVPAVEKHCYGLWGPQLYQ